MTQEQREHIVAAIGIMDRGASILRKDGYTYTADVMGSQCEILQEMLDHDRRES